MLFPSFQAVFAPKNYPRAIFLALVVFSCWPLGDAFLKMAREADAPLGEVLLICGLSSMASVFLLSAARGQLANLRPHNWKPLVLLGLCQLTSFICWALALPLLPLANIYIVSFLTPMVVACMAAVFLKESFGWARAGVIVSGFVGVVVAVNPSNLFQSLDAGLPYVFLFGNMLASAAQMFLLRAVAEKEKNESTAFYSRAIMAGGGLLFCLILGFVPIKPWVFLAICGSGVIGGLGWVLLAEAYKCASAAVVAPFQYSQIIWGALIGYLFWADVPDVHLVCGAVIIIVSGLLLVRHERRISRTMPRVN
ncbi:MAG: DMT family transporter [Bdellovibrionales bacterium]|jgi:drug/metabolite transporter (DMT)-like permease